MSRGSYEHMLEVLRKKPRLKEIYDNIEQYSDEDIDKNAAIPTWMKKQFKKVYLKNQQEESLDNAERIAAIMMAKTAFNGTHTFDVYRFRGADTSIGGLDTVHGDLVADIDKDRIKIGNSTVKLSNRHQVLSSCEYLARCDIHEYGRMVQDLIDKKYQLSAPSGRDYSVAGLLASVKRG